MNYLVLYIPNQLKALEYVQSCIIYTTVPNNTQYELLSAL